MISFYNTLTRQLEPFQPLDPAGKRVKLYVCGPTVYDEAHLGHARCYITWDILYRFLQYAGYTVQYARNITDVDDKIINRATEMGKTPEALAKQFTERFHAVMDALNVLKPTHEPHATDYIEQMHTLIAGLIEKGFAYGTPSGTVYYRTTQKENYGNLTHQNLDDLQSGARVDVDPEKESALDFALWKPAPASDPAVWDSPWGPGRPGWHIECSAMSHSLLGEQLDIHAGGMDLIFPHHQNEIAQSEAFTGKTPFVKTWMHNGFVNVSGEKMSKSLGNFATIQTMLNAYDADTLRYFLLTHHYRSPVDFSDQALEGAKNRVQKIKSHLQRLSDVLGELSTEEPVADSYLSAWEDAMAQDLNTAQALSAMDELFNTAVSQEEVTNELKAFLKIARTMGFQFEAKVDLSTLMSDLESLLKKWQEKFVELGNPVTHIHIKAHPDDVIEHILTLRQQARDFKQWDVSDKIRDDLSALGIQIQDKKGQAARWTYEPVRAGVAS